MRVLVTGGTGFLGSRVLPLLAEHDVLCLSRDPGRLPVRPGLRAAAADLGQGGEWTREVAAFRPQWGLHLAWEGLPDYSPERCRQNLHASVRVLDAVARAGVTRVVVAGSCWEYGAVSGPMAEDATPGDVGVFAATKAELLGELTRLASDFGLGFRWARVFFVYGAGQRATSLIPHLQAAYAAGRAPDIREPGSVQDFVHIDDVAEALVTLAAADVPSGIFNVGSGEPTRVGDVANRVADYYGRPRPYPALPEGRGFWADMTKMHSSTAWRARTGIDAGIKKTLAMLDGIA